MELVRSIRRGVPEARQEFATRMRCVPRVLTVLNRRLGSPLNDDDLSDLAQEVVLLIWQKIAQYNGSAALETWAFQFCRLELRNHARRRWRDRGALRIEDSSQEEAVAGDRNPYELDPDGADDMHAMLRHLAAREAEVVRLRHVGRCDVSEISDMLGISLSSVKTHYYRAIDKLRVVLSRRPEELQR